LPTAREVNRTATGSISRAEIEALKRILTKIRLNLAEAGASRAAPAREEKGLTPRGAVSK
ncbi:MAG: hypothetical protein ACREFQ_02845, partial [Stellaceae bacterium]